MTATPALTTDLQRQVLLLEDDLRARVAADADLEGRWKQEHQRAVTKERTAASWVAWRDDRVTQAAVAWVLTSVFIRFCEDNALVEPVWIAGPELRRQEALDAQLVFFRAHPEDTDREWLRSAIDYLAGLPATRALVGAHSALHLVSPSGDAVTGLLDFWRRRDDDGALVHDLADPSLSTRFLGDLYQDLSQHAKDTYALLQTPVFVEEFILDRTLEPALAERPLEGFKLIDPTCGSGHFLLGAFDRLLDRWHRHAPGLELQARVQAALDAIHGVDLNPFAIAIARFRLTVVALKACGLTSLEKAPAFTFHLAVGDSLIHGPDPGVFPGMADRTAFMPFTYTTEDGPLLLAMLEEGSYDVVVGNPPYITVKDKALNKIYRSKYANVCKGTYALTVPFMALFFSLARRGEPAGWVGQITGNSFMKREFGAPLIENLLTHRDLCLVVDTSGAYLPGHGIPTVIVIGCNQAPVGSTVRAVLGNRGEPGRPEDPAKGLVWTSIVEHADDPGCDDDWVTVTDLDRVLLATHPWSLSGGGAIQVMQTLQKARTALSSKIVLPVGRSIRAGADEAFVRPISWSARNAAVEGRLRPLLSGEDVRDWSSLAELSILYPYVYGTGTRLDDGISLELWPWRTLLAARGTFSGDMAAAGLVWWEYMQHTTSAYETQLSIAFAEVATHNHFVLDRGGQVFRQTAPVIKLPIGAVEEDHLILLGILNSSTACFWLKQQCQDKPSNGVKRGYESEAWTVRYQFNGANVADCPIPSGASLELSRRLDSLGRQLVLHGSSITSANRTPNVVGLAEAQVAAASMKTQMIAVQEELDWKAYLLYGVVDQDLTYSGKDLPGIAAWRASI